MKLSLCAAIGLLALTVSEAVKTNPLPAPVKINWASTGAVKVSNNFRIVGPRHDVLSAAYQRTAALIKEERWIPATWDTPFPEFPPFPKLSKRGDDDEDDDEDSDDVDDDNESAKGGRQLSTINVEVADLKTDLQMGADESYTLDITAAGQGTIKSKTVWGALHGLSTLAQLIQGDGRKGLQVEQPVHIEDAPKYTHRGIMLDTARNFYPLQAIYRQIDALAWSKLNVFHWHITDTQSWPIEIKKHPQMTKDAYSPRKVYTQKDVQAVVRYGRARGVRVIPEIDMPGHSSSGWQQVDKKAVTCADSWWDNDGWTHHSAVQPNPGQLDISYPGTYDLIKDVYGEASALFPDNVFHVGYDELNTYCFNYSQSAMDWFKARPGADYSDFSQYFLDNALPIFYDRPGRRLMMWEDVVLSHGMPAKNVPKDIIMQAWNNGTDHVQKLAAQGYDVVVTSADFLYLDCGNGGYVTNDARYNFNEPPPLPAAISQAFDDNKSEYKPTTFNYGGPGGSWCAPYKTWQRIYGYDFTKGLSAEEAAKVIGAEVALWSEQSDATVVDAKVWPRAAALAELLWSGNRNADGFKRTTELTARILDYRERLVGRGVLAAPVVPEYCLKNPHHCDFYRDQTAFGK